MIREAALSRFVQIFACTDVCEEGLRHERVVVSIAVACSTNPAVSLNTGMDLGARVDESVAEDMLESVVLPGPEGRISRMMRSTDDVQVAHQDDVPRLREMFDDLDHLCKERAFSFQFGLRRVS